MRLPSIALVMGTLASLTPLAASHETHLAYLPKVELNNQLNTYLSIKWSIANNSLYANKDQVFPSPTTMQLHVPRYDGSHKVAAGQVPLHFSIDARPLPVGEVSSIDSVVRLNIKLLSQDGELATPSTVVIDLLNQSDGGLRILRVRIQPREVIPAKVDAAPPTINYWSPNAWLSKLGYSAKNKFQSTTNGSGSSHSQTKAAAVSSKVNGVSHTGYTFSPYWSPQTWSSRPHHHSKTGKPTKSPMHFIRPIIFPALLGAAAASVACLLGFVIGHAVMSLSLRLGLMRGRSQEIDVENGSEKTFPVPKILITITEAKASDEA